MGIFLPQRHIRQSPGFTLVEIIVSLGIFAVVAVVALGALVKIVAANKKAQTIQASVTNLNFALDAISREMRVGRNYYCSSVSASSLSGVFNVSTLDTNFSNSTKCPNGSGSADGGRGTVIAFDSTKVDQNGGNPCNLIYAYLFHRGDQNNSGPYTLYKAEQTSCGSPVNNFVPIIDPNVTITGYYVKVLATQENPYPRATIRISGYSGVAEKDKTYFDVQTTVSARVQ